MPRQGVHASGPSLQQTSTLKDKLILYEKGLMKLTEATDVSVIESCRRAVTGLTRQQKAAAFLSSTADSQPTSLIRRLLYLTIPAIANCMRIIVQQCQTSVFSMIQSPGLSAADNPSDDVLLTLCHDIELMFMRMGKEMGQQPVLPRIKAAGLIPAFVDYSQAALRALEHLAAEDTCCTQQQQPDANGQQQQQQQQLLSTDEVVVAGGVMHEVHELWTCLFTNAIGSKVLDDELIAAAPTVVHLAVGTVPLLQTALRNCSDDSSSSSSSSKKADWTPFYLQELCVLRDRAQDLAVFLTLLMVRAQGSDSSEVMKQQQQQQQQQQPRQQRGKQSKKQEQRKPLLLPPDHGIKLLLLTLIRQADRLHSSSRTSSLSGFGTSQQQQQSAKQHAIFSSHTALLVDLGFPTAPAAATAGHRTLSSLLNAPAPTEEVCYSAVMLLQDVIVHCSVTGSSSSRDLHIKQDQQQQQESGQSKVPHHLLLPAVKLLVEIVLLLPEDDVKSRSLTLDAILLLLHAAHAAEDSPVLAREAAAAAAAGSGIMPWAPLLAGIVSARRSVSESEVGPWNLTLPVTTAAGLLVPVMQLMSRVVIHSLKMTETQQQQQQQQKSARGSRAAANRQMLADVVGISRKQQAMFSGSGPMADSSSHSSTMSAEAIAKSRGILLRRFGNLVMIVCKSVESKHIAAALRHDPVIPFITVEAVMRSQACRLMAAGWSQQQWQQQKWQQQRRFWQRHKPFDRHQWAQQAAASQAAEAGSKSSAEGPDTAATELLLFVSQVLMALHMLLERVWNPLPAATYITSQEVPDLLLRTFTTVISACKVYQAVAAAAANTKQQPKHPQELQHQHGPALQLAAAAALADAYSVLAMNPSKTIDSRFSPQLSSRVWFVHLCHFVNIKVMSSDAATTFKLEQTLQESPSRASIPETSSTADPACVQPLEATDEQKRFAEWPELYAEKCILADQGFSCPVLSWCCNNPSCSNLSNLSEYQLVSGKACVCGGCQVARYCSRECQQQHWKQHKGSCHKLVEELHVRA